MSCEVFQGTLQATVFVDKLADKVGCGQKVYPHQPDLSTLSRREEAFMALTDTFIRKIAPADIVKRYADGNGLTLNVSPKGKKVFYLRKRIDGKEKIFNLGVYPAVSLREARQKAASISERLERGLPPLEVKKAVPTLREVAAEWLQTRNSVTPEYRRDMEQRLEKHIFPLLGDKCIAELRAPDILSVLQSIADDGKGETVRRLRQYLNQICRYAMLKEYLERNPAEAIGDALPSVLKKHMPARTNPEEIQQLFRLCMNYYGSSATVRHALLFTALTAARPHMVEEATWDEIDFDTRLWTLSAERMKMRRPHVIPLSDAALAVLLEQKKFSGGNYIFPSIRSASRHISNGAMGAALKAMGVTDHVPHGWRSSFSTVCNEKGFRYDVIEKCLAHEEKNAVRAAYNRAEFMEERREIMQWWADFLTEKVKKQG